MKVKCEQRPITDHICQKLAKDKNTDKNSDQIVVIILEVMETPKNVATWGSKFKIAPKTSAESLSSSMSLTSSSSSKIAIRMLKCALATTSLRSLILRFTVPSPVMQVHKNKKRRSKLLKRSMTESVTLPLLRQPIGLQPTQ